MDLLELLAEGKVEEFNAQRGRRAKLDLFAADLSGASIPEADLSLTNLQKSDLSSADLTGAILARADLSGADLSSTRLSAALAIKSRWREAYMEEVDFTEGDFTGADFTEAEMTRVCAVGILAANSRWKRAQLSGCDLSGADLAESNLSGVQISGSNLSGVTLRGAKLSDAICEGVDLSEADCAQSRWPRANLRGANLAGANLSGADLSGADLTGAIVVGANLTRADLTGATLDDIDLDAAFLTEAEADLPPDLLGYRQEDGELLINKPLVQASGKSIALLWEATGSGGRPRLRMAAGRLGGAPPETATVLPVPADLVVAQQLARHGDGFAVLMLVERPGGIRGSLTRADANGALSPRQPLSLPYTPAAKPIILPTDKGLLLVGISREGPGIQIHRIEGETLEQVHVSALPTVRGFVSDHHPVVLTKGGILLPLTERGVGDPISAPKGFPGRAWGVAPVGNTLMAAWLPSAGKGLQTAQMVAGGPSDVRHILKKEAIGALDVLAMGDTAWAAFTRKGKSGRADAWVMALPDGEPLPLVEATECRDLRFVTGSDCPLVLSTTDRGSIRLHALTDRGSKLVWELSG